MQLFLFFTPLEHLLIELVDHASIIHQLSLICCLTVNENLKILF